MILGFARSRSLEHWSAAGVAILLVGTAWPGSFQALEFYDSASYIDFPALIADEDFQAMGPRTLTYPFVLMLFGTGSALVVMQYAANVAAFCWLGFVLGRVPGMALLGLLSLADNVRLWGSAVLTESLSVSLLAALVALSLVLGRRFGWGQLAVW